MATQAELIERISALRSPEEPKEPTEGIEPVDVSEPGEELEPEELAEPTKAAEVEEESEEPEDLVYEIDGEEITLAQIQAWKKGTMQEADYTQKSQANAELRKSMEAEMVTLQERGSGLKSLIDALETSINADITDEHLAQLLEDDDTGEYLRLTEKKKARLSKLDDAKAARTQLKSERLTEQQKAGNQRLVEMNPNWLESGQVTQTYHDDQALLAKYATDNAFTQDEINSALRSGNIMQAMIEAQRMKSSVSKAPELLKKVRQAPTIVKGKKRVEAGIEKQIQDATARLKKTGRVDDALALKKLKRQRTG